MKKSIEFLILKLESCTPLLGENTDKMVHDAYNVLKFAVPIILLAMSIKDFGTAIISQDNDAIKKSTNTFMKRLIIAVVILVLPTILNFLLELVGIDTCIL